MKAVCNHCGKVLAGQQSNGTSHLLNHIDRCPKRIQELAPAPAFSPSQASNVYTKKDAETSTISAFDPTAFDKALARQKIARMIIMHELPLMRFVKYDVFKDLMSFVQPLLGKICRNTFKREVFKLFDFEKAKTMALLGDITSKDSITMDMWTSNNQKKGYMVVTAHFIDNSWTLWNRILRFIYVPSPHTAEALSSELAKCLLDWNVDQRLFTITVDKTCPSQQVFVQLLARVYEVLQINPNEYSITIKTTLRSSNTLYRICALPMDICDDEMVRVVLHMASDVANFGCIPVFVTTSPRVPSKGIEPHVDTETSFRANMSGPDNDEEVLPRTISLQQYYSPIHNNYDNIDDNGVTLQDVGATVFPITTSLEQRYSPYHNNDFRDNDDFHNETEGDNVCAEPYNNTRGGTHSNNDGNDGGAGPSNVPSFQHEDECEDNTPMNNRGNRPIPSMVQSRRRIDPLTSLAPTLPSNMVAPSFVSSCDSDDISVGKLFAEKNEFILQLRKVAFRDKFDFKIARSTTTPLGSSIKGFMQYIRPVIAVDGTHLKGLYRGSMFVATCLDGKTQLYPLGIGIMDSENNDAWEWFMMKLHGVIGDRPELVIISYRCTTIRRAVLKVFHNETHGVCFYHVKGNIKSQFRMSKALWDEFEPVFINAAKAYGHKEFKRQLEGLWMIHSGAADYLENNVGTCNWARSQFEGRRYNILTTNIAESVNSFMREPRKFHVTHLVDHFRKTLQQWFYDRKIMAESMTTRLTTWADEIVTERRTIAERMIVRPVSPHRFQVIGGGLKEGLVDLQKRTCSCRVFQLDQLVCAHAIVACLTHRSRNLFLLASTPITYAQPVEPVGDVADWEVPDEIQEIQVYPPVEAPPPGRRKELRIPSAGEDVNRQTVRCGQCHELVHNRKRCKNLIALTRS
ncbi:SWIM-type domain-containing protein [Citrus sinensis]|nr:SWIM-type domain-containing protein [Citrus sinensis]